MEETAPNSSATSNSNYEIEIEEYVQVPNHEQVPDLESRGLRYSLEQIINKAPKLLNSKAADKSCSIFRVPKKIMELHPKYFQPEIVSIGPYYHGEERLEMMEEQKCRIVKSFLGYLREGGVDLDEVFNSIEEKEEKIRGCYSHSIDKYSPEKLIQMMIIDGFFIINLLCVVGEIIIPESNDPIFNFPWMISSVTRDLLMLENQIPFFVLQTLYDNSLEDSPPLQELILMLMNISLPRYSQVSKLCDKYKTFGGEHILDFYWSTYIPSRGNNDLGKTFWCWEATKETRDRRNSLQSTNGADNNMYLEHGSSSSNSENTNRDIHVMEPRAKIIQYFKKHWIMKKLHGLFVGIRSKEKADKDESLLRFIQPIETLLQAGINFKKREGTDTFLDIEFSHGALKIPRLVTGEIMSTLILNCIMFEQCYKHRTKHFISYFNFMGHLMNSSFDARYLREKKIIENFFGTDQELVNFFNEVGKNITYYFNVDYFMEVTKNVEIYYRSVRHVGWAEFKYKYCGSLWISVSAVAALFLILLTILQTIFTVYPYFNPRD